MQEIILIQRKSALSAGNNSPQITRIYADAGKQFKSAKIGAISGKQ